MARLTVGNTYGGFIVRRMTYVNEVGAELYKIGRKTDISRLRRRQQGLFGYVQDHAGGQHGRVPYP